MDRLRRARWFSEIEQKRNDLKVLHQFLQDNPNLPNAVEEAIGIQQGMLSHDIGALNDRIKSTMEASDDGTSQG